MAQPEPSPNQTLRRLVDGYQVSPAIHPSNLPAAVPDHGAVLLAERVLGPRNEDRATKFSDLNMLVGAGGRERTVEEFAALLDAAGFRLSGVTGSAGGFSVIEGAPV